MEKAGNLLDVPSQSSSYRYLFGDHDQYLDASHSDSHSSAPSPYIKFLGEMAGESASPSPASRETDDGRESSPEVTAPGEIGAQSKAKRKRENRYKNAPPSVISRRRAQNRASQRAYRERKDQRIKDLEQLLNEARARNEVLSQAYAELQAEYAKLKSSPSPASNVDAQNAHMQNNNNHHHQHHQHHLLTTPYSSISGPSLSMNLGDMFADSAPMAVLNAEGDPGPFYYPSSGSYAL